MNLYLFCAIWVFVSGWALAEESKDVAGKISNESELAIVITTGNSRTESWSAKQKIGYEWDSNLLAFHAKFLTAKTSGVQSAKNWGLGIRYEKALVTSFSLYLGEQVEGNIFSGIKQKYDSDLGGKYVLTKSEVWSWFAEGGYRYSIENRSSSAVKQSYLRLYSELERVWSAAFSSKLWLEFLPNLSESSDRQVNLELSSSAVLSSVFSLKVGYLVRYRSILVGNATAKTDGTYTTSLVGKF